MSSFFFDFNNLALLGLALVSGAVLAWLSISNRRSGSVVTLNEATQLINRRDAMVVDVREASEFESGHLAGAIHLPLDQVGVKAANLLSNKSQPLIVVCQSGTRSSRGCSELRRAGYAEVVNLAGGIEAWKQAGLPLVKGKK